MIKKLLSILFTLIISSSCVLAADYHQTMTPEVARAIQKYKARNYVGCLQELSPYLRKSASNKRNQLATYYMGMAYVKVGLPERARIYYQQTKELNPNNTLGKYADKGLVCIDNPSDCYTLHKEVATNNKPTYTSELDKFVHSPYGNGLSSDLNKEIERKRVERLRKEINSDQDLNMYDFKDYRDFTNKKGDAKTDKIDGAKLASSSNPTDAEILQAIKVLNAAGLNNIAKQAETSHNAQQVKQEESTATTSENEVKSAYKPDITREEYQKQIQREMMEAQMAAMAQPNIGALFGEKNNNQNNMMNNNMMNMLPFMMAQQAQQNGNSNGQQMMMTPDMMQAMMLNSMMPNLNFGSDSNNN